MLIVTRRIGETVTVGDDVAVTILGINRSYVPVGIRAPKSVLVYREEIYNRIASDRARRVRGV
jgi:carbon storage regulator